MSVSQPSLSRFIYLFISFFKESENEYLVSSSFFTFSLSFFFVIPFDPHPRTTGHHYRWTGELSQRYVGISTYSLQIHSGLSVSVLNLIERKGDRETLPNTIYHIILCHTYICTIREEDSRNYYYYLSFIFITQIFCGLSKV